MKSLKLIILTSILSCFALNCFAQGKLKIVDRSSRKQPIWLNSTENEYIITSAIANDIERAKEMCLENVKKNIIDAVAQNVKSSDKSTISQETINSGIVNFLDKYSSSYETQSANVPFMTGVSISKVEESYWEKRMDKSTKKISYLYSIKYPFPSLELKKMIHAFKEQDDKMSNKLDALTTQLDNINSIEQIDVAINDLETLTKYFFDDVRKNQSKNLTKNYKSLYSKIGISRISNELGNEKFALMLGNKILSYAKAPKVKSETAFKLQTKQENNGVWSLTYDYSTCYPDEENIINVAWVVNGKTLKNHFYIDLEQESAKIKPIKEIHFTGDKDAEMSLSNVKMAMTIKTDDNKTYAIKKITIKAPCFKSVVIFKNLNEVCEGKGIYNIETTLDRDVMMNETSSLTSKLLQGSMEINFNNKTKIVDFYIPYSTNW